MSGRFLSSPSLFVGDPGFDFKEFNDAQNDSSKIWWYISR